MKSQWRRREPHEEQMALQITSMADIFIIVLVFLLKSYATGALDLAPVAGLVLPQTVAHAAPSKAPRVEIAEHAVLVEGQPKVKLRGFAFPAGAIGADGTSAQLTQALGSNAEGKLLVVSDKRVPYATLKTVLASAARGGYRKFQMAVNPTE